MDQLNRSNCRTKVQNSQSDKAFKKVNQKPRSNLLESFFWTLPNTLWFILNNWLENGRGDWVDVFWKDIFRQLLLMLQKSGIRFPHLGWCKKPCKSWDKLTISTGAPNSLIMRINAPPWRNTKTTSINRIEFRMVSYVNVNVTFFFGTKGCSFVDFYFLGCFLKDIFVKNDQGFW